MTECATIRTCSTRISSLVAVLFDSPRNDLNQLQKYFVRYQMSFETYCEEILRYFLAFLLNNEQFICVMKVFYSEKLILLCLNLF